MYMRFWKFYNLISEKIHVYFPCYMSFFLTSRGVSKAQCLSYMLGASPTMFLKNKPFNTTKVSLSERFVDNITAKIKKRRRRRGCRVWHGSGIKRKRDSLPKRISRWHAIFSRRFLNPRFSLGIETRYQGSREGFARRERERKTAWGTQMPQKR